MTEWEVYLIAQADKFGVALLTVATLFFVCFALALFFCVDPYMEDKARYGKFALIFLIISSFFFFSWAIVPSTESLIAIYVVPKIVNNEDLKKMHPRLIKLADEWLEELHPKKKDSKSNK